MREGGYGAPDIDTTSAQRRAGEAQITANFVSDRALASGSGSLTVGARSMRPSSPALNDFYYETDTHWLYYWGGTAWLFLAGLNSGTNATRAAITVTANDNGAAYLTTDQNKLWLVSGAAWVDRFTTLDLVTSLKINGTKVIGAQGAAVADVASAAATDLPTVITLANEIKTQLNLLLARTRAATGHGLIA